MSQHSHHDVVFGDAPIVGHFQSNGRTIPTYCRGDLSKVILGMGLLTKHSLPLNGTVRQGGAPTNGQQSAALAALN